MKRPSSHGRSVPLLIACLIGPASWPAAVRGQDVPIIRLSAPLLTLEREFTMISSVRELSDARLLLADRRERRLAIVDWNTGQASNVGREGDGPGEYHVPHRLYALGGDSTLLTDAQSRRWHIMHGGEFVATLPATHALVDDLGPTLLGSSRDRVLAAKGFRWDPSAPFPFDDYADSSVVVMARAVLGDPRLDTIARIKGPGAGAFCVSVRGVSGATLPATTCNRLRSEERALLFGDGAVAIVRIDPYRVDWLLPDDREVNGVALPVTPETVTDDHRCATIRNWPYTVFAGCSREMFEGLVWPESMPPVLSTLSREISAPYTDQVLAAPGGQVVVRRAPSLSNPGTWYDVVNREGELTVRIHLPANQGIIGFGSGAVFVLESDEFGLQRLSRHPWPS